MMNSERPSRSSGVIEPAGKPLTIDDIRKAEVAYRRYSHDYVDEEADAQAARRGIWGSAIVKPWEWRRGERIAANDNAPGQCRIKGNINRKGERIYHAPGDKWYDRTRIDPAKGERWFCSEAEAIAAGWRKALR